MSSDHLAPFTMAANVAWLTGFHLETLGKKPCYRAVLGALPPAINKLELSGFELAIRRAPRCPANDHTTGCSSHGHCHLADGQCSCILLLG